MIQLTLKAEKMSHLRTLTCAVVAALTLAVSANADFVITGPTSFTTTGIGDFAAMGGTANVASAFGQITPLLDWPAGTGNDAGEDSQTLAGGAPNTVSGLLALLPSGFGVNNSLVFSLGINENGGAAGMVDLTALSITVGTSTFDLGANTVTVFNHESGQGDSEAYIQVDLPMTLDQIAATTDVFDASGTITGRTNGAEVLFLTSATVVVPEPSAFLYGGVVAAIAGLGYRRRQKSVA